MRIRNVMLAAIAATVTAGAAAAPASAQDVFGPCDIQQPQPVECVKETVQIDTYPGSFMPCQPQANVPDAVNCAFLTAVWALDQVELEVTHLQNVFNQQYENVRLLVEQGFVALDDAQKLVVAKTCEAMGVRPEDCPEI